MCNVTGVKVAVRIIGDPSLGSAEERLAEDITAAASAVNKCAPIVDQLLQQYRQTSLESDKCRYQYLIEKEYRRVLEGVAPWDRIEQYAKLMTRLDLGDVRVDRAEAVSSIILYCEVNTVAALSYLQQMIDSDELSRLISVMLILLADTDIIATASLSAQEYDAALASLYSAAGKVYFVIILFYKPRAVDFKSAICVIL